MVLIFRTKCLFTLFVAITTLLFLPFLIKLNLKSDNHFLGYVGRSAENFTSESSAIRTITNCVDKKLDRTFRRRGHFWVFQNFVRAEKNFACDESITYTAPADFRFLDNLPPLVNVWMGPISVALYAPGDDFKITLHSIAYLRNCETRLIRELVTFHVFFEEAYIPKGLKKPLSEYYEDFYQCTKGPPFRKVVDESTFKAKNQLTFPINVARNVARETAQTHFIFPSDIELFPTPNFIENFLQLVVRKKQLFTNNTKKVFVLPIFEILSTQEIPESKLQLQKMIKNNKAFLFHQRICSPCHKVINGSEWVKENNDDLLDIFSVGKRHGNYEIWEPFYIGTNEEPLFDERLTWEGQFNKMSQAYSLCLLNYDFMVLNKAFLIHRPGIKKKKVQVQKHQQLIDQSKIILKDIRRELIALYGRNRKCVIAYNV